MYFSEFVAIHSTKRTITMIRNTSPDHELILLLVLGEIQSGQNNGTKYIQPNIQSSF